LNVGAHTHCAIYERELKRLSPLDLTKREEKIAQFAKAHDFRLRFYHKGLCAIFDTHPRMIRTRLQSQIAYISAGPM
jgi:hypothetical protein